MSTDQRVTKDLIETLKDGKDGFAHAAERLTDSDRPDLATTMQEFSRQRAELAAELEQLAAQYGDDIQEEGSLAAKAHRGWMTVRDAITGSDPRGVLDAAEQGEDHAVSEFADAARRDDISPELRSVVERQYATVKAAHDQVKTLRDSV